MADPKTCEKMLTLFRDELLISWRLKMLTCFAVYTEHAPDALLIKL